MTSERGGRTPIAPQPSLFDAAAPDDLGAGVAPAPDPDADARAHAVDPRHNVVLEASAGTGKTSVLVARYVNLLKAGVDPANILAITFTRKAAAEMRERIVRELRRAADRSESDRRLWLELRDRLGDVAISTIDAFCLSLLREFPLEADVDPGFDLADDTEVPRLVSTALDRTMRILAGVAKSDRDVALVLAQLGIARTRQGLATLLDRRLVAWSALDHFLAKGPRELTADAVCRSAAEAFRDALCTIPGGLKSFLADGPAAHPRYELFLREVERLVSGPPRSEAAIRATLDRLAAHFLTNEGRARRSGTIPPYRADHYPSKEAARRHREALFGLAPRVEEVMSAFRRDLNVVLARGVRRMFAVAVAQYRQALEERSVLDFSDVLQRAVELLRRMDEFSQSRFRLEARYHHVLVDEFQDTSRAQWELISLLVQAWGEGVGVAASPSIFVVGDRKQSIYRFRDAEVAVLEQAAGYIEGLRPGTGARRAITRSFRAVPPLLHFVNDVFSEISRSGEAPGEFTYGERDRFPVDRVEGGTAAAGAVLGLSSAESADTCAAAVADEVARLLTDGTVRDTATGLPRSVRPGDIAILSRSRSSHREFERELGARGIPTYVYKGLGFFDADEIKDMVALLRYLAEPGSPLRAAAFLRSRFIRVSDAALAALAPDLTGALVGGSPGALERLAESDRRILECARADVERWLLLVDRVTPAELLDRVLAESAYFYELRGARRRQAWENVKKLRGLIRRIQNRGYATLRRIADHLMSISAGDESNAVIEALDAVNLMTVHASKGLEFPVVFVVNLAKGASGPPQPVRVLAGGDPEREEPSVAIGPFISDSDEAEREAERHETRRLLYVALTRARDRLYLASVLKDGRHVAGRGSLAEVLPESLAALFGSAAALPADQETTEWTARSGRIHSWRICRPAQQRIEWTGPGAAEDPRAATPADDFLPAPPARARVRVSVRNYVADGIDRGTAGSGRSDRLFGALVHRLFEHGERFGPGVEHAPAAALALRLLRKEEAAAVDSPDELASRAAAAWLRSRKRPDIVETLRGERLYEVPFSLLSDDEQPVIVRGTIDLLVRRSGPALTVVEFKTGRPREAHQRQLDLYVRAARALYPEAAVAGSLLYV